MRSVDGRHSYMCVCTGASILCYQIQNNSDVAYTRQITEVTAIRLADPMALT